MSTKPSCRLTPFIAPAARRAVILRHGPSKWVHMILWHMHHDHFEHGSWFNGRIYEDCSDLSPDGIFFLYFASGYRWRNRNQNPMTMWTAICRPPWVEALAIYPTYGHPGYAGGYFVDDHDRSAFHQATAEACLPRNLRIEYRRARPQTTSVQVEGADWAGLDHKSRVIYSICGKLWRCTNTQGKVRNPVLIADFTELVPPKRGVKLPD